MAEIQESRERYSLRANVLDTAKELITGDRNNTYGDPHQDFSRTAGMITALFSDKLREGVCFEAADVALIQMCVKMSRLQWTPQHFDGWVDLGGYAGCGYEAAMYAPRKDDDEDV